MTLQELKRLIDELYETNNYGYDNFNVRIHLDEETEVTNISHLKIDLKDHIVEIEY